jgi:hypothetical protein
LRGQDGGRPPEGQEFTISDLAPRTGSRTNQLMTDIAKSLDEATLADVAAYYAAQPKRNPDPATLAESPPAIVHLVEACRAGIRVTLSPSRMVRRR